MAEVVSFQDPRRPIADMLVMTRGFMGRPEPLCDERGEPINFAPSFDTIARGSRTQAEAAIRDAQCAAEHAAMCCSFLEDLD